LATDLGIERVELEGALEARAGPSIVPVLSVEAGLKQVELVVAGRAVDRLAERLASRREVAGALVEQRKLGARLGRPRLEVDRVVGGVEGALEVAARGGVAARVELVVGEVIAIIGGPRRPGSPSVYRSGCYRTRRGP